MGFNPRPHRGAGATSRRRQRRKYSTVSILARTEARALHRDVAQKAIGDIVSILARTEARALHQRAGAPRN